MNGVIKARNGQLYVLVVYGEFAEPYQRFTWWRVLGRRGTGYGEHPEEGDLVTYTRDGSWAARHPESQRATGAITTGDGSTEAELVERVSVSPPPARGKQLRWHEGRWQRLMARGWCDTDKGESK